MTAALDLDACVENLDTFVKQGDARSCRDIALAAIREVRALRRDLAANEGSEDARLAIAEAEVARLRPVVEAARRVVYPGGVDEFNGLVAAVSRFNAESPELSAQEVPW